MPRTLALSLCFTSALFLVLGCATPADETLDQDESVGAAAAALLDPPKGANHFCPTCFWAHDSQAAYRTMGAGPLDQGMGVLPVLVIDPAYRSEVIQNAIECGLGQDQHVFDPVGNRTYSGHWGLATSWTTEPLSSTQRRWVTGCMAQRLNAFGKPVDILLEGRATPIMRDQVAEAEFPWDESTVWGDLFSSVTPLGNNQTPAFELYACSDGDLEATCTGLGTPADWLDDRICDTSPACGLTVLGSCANPLVCNVNASGYPICETPAGVSFSQTVHVKLAEGMCLPPP